MSVRHVIATLGLALAGAGTAVAAPPPTLVPGQLTVGLSMPSEGFQTGSVIGDDVVFAQGLEIDLARQLGARMELPNVRFKQARQFPDLFSADPHAWDIGIGQISTLAIRKKTTDFSISYMGADQGVLMSRTARVKPRTVGALRPLRLCVEYRSTGASIVSSRVKPTRAARTFTAVQDMMQALQSGRCDAVVYDAPTLATLRNRVPNRYGGFAGRLVTNEKYGITIPKGSPLLQPVNAGLRQMIVDGAITALQKRWLAANLNSLPVIR